MTSEQQAIFNQFHDDERNKWFSLTLLQQMVNIGNEVKRAMKVKSDQDKKNAFLENALKYTHLSMNDPKNEKVIPELKIGENENIECISSSPGRRQKTPMTKDEVDKFVEFSEDRHVLAKSQSCIIDRENGDKIRFAHSISSSVSSTTSSCQIPE